MTKKKRWHHRCTITRTVRDDNEKDERQHLHLSFSHIFLLSLRSLGITSDPLTHFSCVLSALIHDVDHAGVPNSQLCIENKTLADVYQGKSVAEQNSFSLSWDMLMDDQFADLRSAIYTTEVERQRFRGLVVNSVMATDIMDKDLKAARNVRWEKAFSEQVNEEKDPRVTINRKATIVIEHLIQASDVAHTMQVRTLCTTDRLALKTRVVQLRGSI
jgi:3'5'-cyclic nucleotide phosphodiesterase